jgi:hypothetical protein
MRGGLGLREFVILICLYEQVCLSYTDQIIIISVAKGVGVRDRRGRIADWQLVE